MTIRILTAGLLLASAGWGGEVLDRVALVVDKRVITLSDVLQEARLAALQDRKPVDLSPAGRKLAADRLLDRSLLDREMELNRYPQAERSEAEALLEQVKKQYESEAGYQKALRSTASRRKTFSTGFRRRSPRCGLWSSGFSRPGRQLRRRWRNTTGRRLCRRPKSRGSTTSPRSKRRKAGLNRSSTGSGPTTPWDGGWYARASRPRYEYSKRPSNEAAQADCAQSPRPRLLVAGAACALAVIGVLRSTWFQDRVRQRIVAEVESATGGRVELEHFAFDWRDLKATLRGFTLHGLEPAGETPLFHGGKIEIGIRILSMLEREVDVASIRLEQPLIHIRIDGKGVTNIPHPARPRRTDRSTMESLLRLAVKRFELVDGELKFGELRVPVNIRAERLGVRLDYDRQGPRYRGDFKRNGASSRAGTGAGGSGGGGDAGV